METKKTYDLGMLKLNVRIIDEYVILTTNIEFATKQVYEQAIAQGKEVTWDNKAKACIQKYKGKTAKQIEAEIDAEVSGIAKNKKQIEGKIKKEFENVKP